jgi:hypothetical protein
MKQKEESLLDQLLSKGSGNCMSPFDKSNSSLDIQKARPTNKAAIIKSKTLNEHQLDMISPGLPKKPKGEDIERKVEQLS